MTVINDTSNFWHFAYAWQFHSDELNSTLKADWQLENMLTDKGPLMALYASMGDGKIIEGELDEEQRGSSTYLEKNPQYEQYDFISEGDSPSYFYLFQNGLNNVNYPDYGGWGGRFGQNDKSLAQNTVLDYNPHSNQFEASYTLTRWFDDIQNDFAARVDWGVTSDYEEANHAPEASVKEGIRVTVKVGEDVQLTAQASDPDGDRLSYKWWRYFEADTYQEYTGDTQPGIVDYDGLQIDLTRSLDKGEVVDPIELINADTESVTFTIPKDAKSGDTFHMILEVEDDGKHKLKTYQRVVLTVE